MGKLGKRSRIAYKILPITINVFHCVCPRILQHCSFSMIGIHPLCPKCWDISFLLFGTWCRNMSNCQLGGKLDIKHDVLMANSKLWLVDYICTLAMHSISSDFHLRYVAQNSMPISRKDLNVTCCPILLGFFLLL